MADLGVIPRENADAVWKAKDVEFDVARIDEIEAVTKHDVIAFLTHLAEHVGSEEARFVHQGMTSSDVLDTCFNIQLVRAADILLADMDQLLAALKRRAQEHKMTVRIGRSHGIHAEPNNGPNICAVLCGNGSQQTPFGNRARRNRNRRNFRRGRHLPTLIPGSKSTSAQNWV